MEQKPARSDVMKGLSEKEVQEKLAKYGCNELPSSKKRNVLNILLEVMMEPMFLLLVAGGIIYFILGDIQEAIMLMGFVVVVIGITLYQEQKTERALEALQDLSSPRALVIRNGKQLRIAGRDVVPEDTIMLSEGDRVPADAVLISSSNILADESLLTGESVPVRKSIWDGVVAMQRPGGDDLPFIYSGTLIVQGHCTAEVLSTGANTEIGKIGKSLQKPSTEQTRMQKETGKMVKDIALLGGALCILLVLIYGITKGNWLQGILSGITLAMAMLPEEFPVVLTIFLALGAWRISKKNVLTRKISAIEALGSTTVLCVDKTGTLTQNKMAIAQLYADNQFFDVKNNDTPPEYLHELIEFGILASNRNPFDPMEQALKKLGETKLLHTEHLHHDWELIQEYPLSKKLLSISHVWKSSDNNDYIIAAKGAPEAIFDLCHLSEKQKSALEIQINSMASKGLRVIAVAKTYFKKAGLPKEQHDFPFQFVGCVGFEDPIRPGIRESIQQCYQAGIRVVMITGDYPGTAQKIAREAEMQNIDNIITGPQLDAMSDQELEKRIKNVSIFARVVPEQKLRIVKAFKTAGEIVSMTGDGVNDAPALKHAHIGIAMGGRGTDVAREAAALVLLDDNFSSIVSAIRLGRRIYRNIRKAMAYIVAIHIPIAGLALLPAALNMPFIFTPIHIVFMELIIDPACTVVFEGEQENENIMKRPPRNPHEMLFNKKIIILSLFQGAFVLGIVFFIFIFFLNNGHTDIQARALAFTTLIIANLGLILTNRSWSRSLVKMITVRNDAVWYIIGGASLILILSLTVPAIRVLFHFGILHPQDILLTLGTGILSILWFELVKTIRPVI